MGITTFFKILVQFILLIFPWGLRRRLLNCFFNFKIETNSKVGFSIILSDILIMKKESRIHSFTFVKNIDLLFLDEFSDLGGFNFLTGYNTNNTTFFKSDPERKCEFRLGIHTRVTTRHFFDCNGGIYIGDYTTIAGSNTQILTHSIDVYRNIQTVSPVIIGKYCFVGTKSILLKGAILPDYSILGAGSLMIKKFQEINCLYAGNPAKKIKEIKNDDVKYFKRNHGNVE